MFLLAFFKGYVTINVECARPERFLNLLISRGISVHNIDRLSRNSFGATVKWRDLTRAQLAAEEAGCRLTVTGRGGLPNAAASLLRRPVLAVSLVLAAAALIVLSGRLLAVDLSSCDPEALELVRGVLNREGARVGSRLSKIDCEVLEEKLRSAGEGVLYADLRLDGAILRVRLVRSGTAEKQTGGRPSSIVANKDCVIRRIAVFDGKAVVSAGRAVRRGELLVSGDITPDGAAEPILVPSQAEIEGEVAYRFGVTVERTALRPIPSGNSAPALRLSLFSFKADTSTGFERSEFISQKRSFITACPLPVFVERGEALEIVLARTGLDDGEMLEEALAGASKQLASAVPKDARIISKQTETVWNPDGSLTLYLEVRTIENIGYPRYL